MIQKRIFSLVLIMALLLPAPSYSQNLFENTPWWFWCCVAVTMPFVKIAKEIDDARTLTLRINGAKAVFQKNTVEYNGALKGAILKGELIKPVETQVHGKRIYIEPGTVVFHKNGTLAHCSIRESGLLTGNNLTVACSIYAQFHENGFLEGTWLGYDGRAFLLQGKERRIRGDLRFHENGLVSRCVLVEGAALQVARHATQVPANTALGFSAGHHLTYIQPPEGMSVTLHLRGKSLDIAGQIHLYESGTIRACRLTWSMNIKNGLHKVRVGKNISFHDNEMIDACMLTNPVTLTINGNDLEFDKSVDPSLGSPGTSMEFYRNGRLKAGETTRNKKQFYVHRGMTIYIADGYRISFYESGSLRQLCPVAMTEIRAGGQKLLLAGDPVMFYENGDILSASIDEGVSFMYHGKRIKTGLLTTRLYFDARQNVTAFINDEKRVVLNKGKKFTLPQYYTAGYTDYETKEISFVGINHDDLKVPDTVDLYHDEHNRYTEIFVKADTFYNDSSHSKVMAEGVREILFVEDAVILLAGRERLCRAMEWVKLR